MSKDIAVSVRDVDKYFDLPHQRTGNLKALFANPLSMFKIRQADEKQCALKDINFEIKKGEFFGIVGRNGSGKSTLLKILAGIYQPNRGEVDVEGKIVPFIELGVGFNGELTGRENVYLNGALLGFSTSEIDEKYDEIVHFAELSRFMDQKLKNYSSGMQVRLAFSVATKLAESDILLIDEVLAVGDADFQRKCYTYFKGIKKKGKTVVFVSHDMNAVREYCDRALLIEDTKIVAVGKSSLVSKLYSKMFVDNAKTLSTKPNEIKRWGTGVAQYKSVDVAVLDNNRIRIKCKIKFNKKLDDPVVGFMVKTESGTPVLGTNSQIIEKKLDSAPMGDELGFIWEFENILSDGTYFVDPAITYNGGTETADWWEEAERFEIIKEHHTPYPVSPEIKLINKK